MGRWVIILLALMQLAAAAPAPALAPPDPVGDDRVSLVALIANPPAYDGRHVAVTGYLNLEFEGDALYLGKEAFDAFQTEDAIWLDGPKFGGKGDRQARRALTRHWVTAYGVFRADRKGMGHSYAGTLVVDSVETDPIPQRFSMQRFNTFSEVPLPWPSIMAALATVTLLFLGHHLGRRGTTPPSRAQSLAKPTLSIRGQPLAWTILSAAFSLFTILGMVGARYFLPSIADGNIPFDIWVGLFMAQALIGLIATPAMWWSHLTGRRVLCAIFMLAQLAAPASREFLRMDTWRDQLTYPFQIRLVFYSSLHRWVRPASPPEHR